jgi:uncharacterized SAM-binding protein YcdF (DUF218 family)
MQRQQEILIGERKRRKIARLPAFLVLLFLFGSAWPHYSASKLPEAAGGGKPDAILVLAGGEKRILAGLAALKKGKADRMFVLGTGHSVQPREVIPGYDSLPEPIRSRIELEGWSETTLENALSAKGIVKERGLRGVVLVTSDYHMPRAYLALRHAIPESVPIAAMPVRSEWRGVDARWRKARLFLGEAWKYWGYRLLLRWE